MREQARTTVLVTGGAGAVGVHVVRALAEAGHRVVTVDDLSRGRREAVRWGAFVPASIDDEEKLAAVFGAHPVDVAVHLAPREQLPPLLDGLLYAGVRALVVGAELDCTVAVCGLPRDTLILRWARAAGLHPDGSMGESRPRSLIAHALAATAEAPLPVATGLPTEDGTTVRDYVHLWDLAQAFVRAVELRLDGEIRGVLDLGTGRGYSTRQVLELVAEHTGRAVPTREVQAPPGTAPELRVDPAPAMDRLGWSPRHDLAAMVEHEVAGRAGG